MTEPYSYDDLEWKLDELVEEASNGGFGNELIAVHLVRTAASLVGRSGLQRLRDHLTPVTTSSDSDD